MMKTISVLILTILFLGAFTAQATTNGATCPISNNEVCCYQAAQNGVTTLPECKKVYARIYNDETNGKFNNRTHK